MELDIIRAWKDEIYRRTLSEEQKAQLPESPIGNLELSDADLEIVQSALAGGGNSVGGVCPSAQGNCTSVGGLCLTLGSGGICATVLGICTTTAGTCTSFLQGNCTSALQSTCNSFGGCTNVGNS